MKRDTINAGDLIRKCLLRNRVAKMCDPLVQFIFFYQSQSFDSYYLCSRSLREQQCFNTKKTPSSLNQTHNTYVCYIYRTFNAFQKQLSHFLPFYNSDLLFSFNFTPFCHHFPIFCQYIQTHQTEKHVIFLLSNTCNEIYSYPRTCNRF